MPIALTTKRVWGRLVLNCTLMSAVAAPGDGEWVNVEGYNPINVHFDGITSATAELDMSNSPTRPADNTHGFKLNEVTANGAIVVNVPVKWLKARCTVYSSGTINAWAEGSEPR